MKILLLEDEPYIAENLKRLVLELEENAEVIGPLDNVKEAEELLQTIKPDLIISDIQLADGISLDLFSSRPLECPVIFTTAYDEYAVRAFKVNSIDYLLKPVDKTDLKQALDKWHQLRTKYNNVDFLSEISKVLGNINESRKYKETFLAHKGREIILIPVVEVACFSREEVIYLWHREGKKFITDFRSLDEIEELLNPNHFFRANRQHIIALSAIHSFHIDESSKVILQLKPLQTEITISKEKAAGFRRWVQQV